MKFLTQSNASWKSCLLAGLAVVALTSCGSQETEKPDDPSAAPAPEISSVEDIQAEPFAHYFDLSQLSQATLAEAVQDVQKTGTLHTDAGDITVQVSQTMGDGQCTLYVAMDAVYPDGMSPDPATWPSVALVKGAVTAQDQGTTLPADLSVNVLQTQDNTISYLIGFSQLSEAITGEDVTLFVGLENARVPLTWTVENHSQTQTADLLDNSGKTVGQAILTPFALSLHMTAWDEHQETPALTLLDKTGAPLPETWVTSGDLSNCFLSFFTPMELGTVQTVQVVSYTGSFS